MLQSSIQLASLVELLGQLWLREITLETLTAIGRNEFKEPYLDVGGFVPASVDVPTVESLAIEYCELLIGPKGHISPVQSVWSDNRFHSESAASMARFFELVPAYQPGSNLLDHVGVQLDFLSTLLRLPADKFTSEITGRFIEAHLAWTPAFLDQVAKRADAMGSGFYQGLANVTGNLIGSLKQTSP